MAAWLCDRQLVDRRSAKLIENLFSGTANRDYLQDVSPQLKLLF
jgi:hypothetical protein